MIYLSLYVSIKIFVYIFSVGRAQQPDDFLHGGAAHDGIVDHYHLLAFEHPFNGIELDANAEVSTRLRRLDEGPAHVVVADEADVKPDFALLRKPERRGCGRVRHSHHHVGTGHGYMLFGQLPPQPPADLVDIVAEHRRNRAARNRCIRKCSTTAAARA